MKEDESSKILTIKQNVKLAFDEFVSKYKNASKGISELKTMIILSNDLKEIKLLEGRFFGYITKSLRAKRERAKLEEL